MITSFRQYRYYVEQDEQANGGKHRFLYIGDEIKKYLKLMRCREYIYYLNKRKPNAVLKIYDNYLRYRLHKLGVKLGFGIPINCAEPGLRIDHFGFVAIIVNKAKEDSRKYAAKKLIFKTYQLYKALGD